MITKAYLLSFDIFNDNEFLDLYVDLVNNNIFTDRDVHRTNLHHIVPKYYYIDNDLDIDSSDNNVVNLLYKDHILAHYYLARCSKTASGISKNSLSIRFLLKGKSLDSFNIDEIDLDYYQYMYELGKEHVFELTHAYAVNKKISEKLMGRPSPNKNAKKYPTSYRVSRKNPNAKNKLLSEQASKRIGSKNPFYGKVHSDETKQAIALKNGKPVLMVDLVTGETVARFNSMNEAARYLMDNKMAVSMASSGAISKVCKGLAKRAYGYSWKFADKV